MAPKRGAAFYLLHIRAREACARGNLTFTDFYRMNDSEILPPPIRAIRRGRWQTPRSAFNVEVDPSVYLYPFIKPLAEPQRERVRPVDPREGNEAVFLNELKFQRIRPCAPCVP